MEDFGTFFKGAMLKPMTKKKKTLFKISLGKSHDPNVTNEIKKEWISF